MSTTPKQIRKTTDHVRNSPDAYIHAAITRFSGFLSLWSRTFLFFRRKTLDHTLGRVIRPKNRKDQNAFMIMENFLNINTSTWYYIPNLNTFYVYKHISTNKFMLMLLVHIYICSMYILLMNKWTMVINN